MILLAEDGLETTICRRELDLSEVAKGRVFVQYAVGAVLVELVVSPTFLQNRQEGFSHNLC